MLYYWVLRPLIPTFTRRTNAIANESGLSELEPTVTWFCFVRRSHSAHNTPLLFPSTSDSFSFAQSIFTGSPYRHPRLFRPFLTHSLFSFNVFNLFILGYSLHPSLFLSFSCYLQSFEILTRTGQMLLQVCWWWIHTSTELENPNLPQLVFNIIAFISCLLFHFLFLYGELMPYDLFFTSKLLLCSFLNYFSPLL